MGFCSKRSYLLLLCTLQFMTTGVRQMFDFLGFMWAPILMNFFLLLFTIFGFFGTCQYKTKYILSNSDLLNFGTGSVSWWESNGPQCKAIFHANNSNIEQDPFRPMRPDLITGCVLDYQYVETLQAWVQIMLSIFGASIGLSFKKAIENGVDDDEFQSSKPNKKVKAPPPLYSIKYSARQDSRLDDTTDEPSEASGVDDDARYASSSRPITPRRVKRRSNHPPPPLPSTLKRGAAGGSTRASRRRSHPAAQAVPAGVNDSSTSADSFRHQHPYSASQATLLYPGPSGGGLGTPNPAYLTVERPPSARSSYSNYHGTRAFSYSGGGAGVVGPQVPTNQRRSTFLSNGPPAYYRSQTSVNSETVI